MIIAIHIKKFININFNFSIFTTIILQIKNNKLQK